MTLLTREEGGREGEYREEKEGVGERRKKGERGSRETKTRGEKEKER